MTKLNLNKLLIGAGVVALVFVAVFFFWWSKNIEIKISPIKEEGVVSSISGTGCDNAKRRPIAVMMASDPETRPLSGISQADIVFEMPVTLNGITRMMAVFQCGEPKEIGSVRSARQDFIPLAASLRAIYIHWGGEHKSLSELNNYIIDNIDALKYQGNTFYRKKGIRAPHNGFTRLDLLFEKAKELSYNLDDHFEGYIHQKEPESKNLSSLVTKINISYNFSYGVVWTYNDQTNTYYRVRNGIPETDKDTSNQVTASVVIIMKTNSRLLRDQYIMVDTVGNGEAEVYQNGVLIGSHWKKDPGSLENKLTFYSQNNKEIEFVPGKIWVEIVTQ